jgi:hypothetical protein
MINGTIINSTTHEPLYNILIHLFVCPSVCFIFSKLPNLPNLHKLLSTEQFLHVLKHVYVRSCFKYLPAYLSFISVSIIYHIEIRILYKMKVRRYLPTYLPTYLLDRRFLTYIPSCWASLPTLELNFFWWGGGKKQAPTLS